MRYRLGDPPPPPNALGIDGEIYVAVAFFGIFIGIAVAVLGNVGDQLWMKVWGAGLTLCSLAYILATALGLEGTFG